jgi:hypothetical protein
VEAKEWVVGSHGVDVLVVGRLIVHRSSPREPPLFRGRNHHPEVRTKPASPEH